MMTLYMLSIYSIHADGHEEDFGIGVFRTKLEADAVAHRYLSEVKGFCEYECRAEILPVTLYADEIPEAVWTWNGWNEDEYSDETDILDGEFYPTEIEASSALDRAKAGSPRAKWVCERWVIGQCDWSEGFVRYTYEA